jgi:site-specific recombinase XerD
MLSEHVSRYIELHRSLGYKFKLQACLLNHFVRFAESRGDTTVRNDSVLAWANEAPSAAQRRSRLLVVRRLSLSLQAEDARHEVPPADAFGRPTREHRTPHIYSQEEIRRLLDAAAQLGPKGSLRPSTYVALISLLVSTGLRIPSALEQVRSILAIPFKKTDEALVDFLNQEELQALLDAPDPKTRSGTRDRAMLYVCFVAGLRVAELVGLRLDDLHTHPQASLRIRGKGRRERVLPLWKETAKVLRAWTAIRESASALELFLNARGEPMTRSGFEYILRKHAKTAAIACPSIASKRVSPHVLRHTCAMHTLQATHDVRKVSLWLGHTSIKSTEIYLRADPTEKLDALESGTAPSLRRGRFKAPDRLLAMLRSS